MIRWESPCEARGKHAAFSKARWARSVRPRCRQLPQGPSVCDKMIPREGVDRPVLGLLSTSELLCSPQNRRPVHRDFRFACPRWPLYTPEGRPAPETLVRHSIVPLQRPSAQPVVTCGRLEALCSRHFSDTAPHVGHCFANRTALPVPRVSLPAPAAPRSAATCRRTAAGLDVLPPAGASSTWHASRAGLRSSPAAAGDS